MRQKPFAAAGFINELCAIAHGTRRAPASPESAKGSVVAHPDERILLMANLIERYVSEHPDAGDTASGISQWWLEGDGGPPAQLQQALDYLVENVRLSRIELAD